MFEPNPSTEPELHPEWIIARGILTSHIYAVFCPEFENRIFIYFLGADFFINENIGSEAFGME